MTIVEAIEILKQHNLIITSIEDASIHGASIHEQPFEENPDLVAYWDRFLIKILVDNYSIKLSWFGESIQLDCESLEKAVQIIVDFYKPVSTFSSEEELLWLTQQFENHNFEIEKIEIHEDEGMGVPYFFVGHLKQEKNTAYVREFRLVRRGNFYFALVNGKNFRDLPYLLKFSNSLREVVQNLLITFPSE